MYTRQDDTLSKYKYNPLMAEDFDIDDADDDIYTPVESPKNVGDLLTPVYQLEPFTPIYDEDSVEQTTKADLQHVNNMLAASAALLPHVHTIPNFCALSVTVCKLIETRRKVKQLPFGPSEEAKGKRKYTVLE